VPSQEVIWEALKSDPIDDKRVATMVCQAKAWKLSDAHSRRNEPKDQGEGHTRSNAPKKTINHSPDIIDQNSLLLRMTLGRSSLVLLAAEVEGGGEGKRVPASELVELVATSLGSDSSMVPL
jgi:hypothetical protein